MIATPRDWLTKAEADFGSANWEMQAPKPKHDAVVFRGQQCIEKLLKEILLAAAVPFDRTHELNVLAHQVKHAHPGWSCDLADLAVLQPGAVLLRYPNYAATVADARRALEALAKLWASLLPLY